MIAMCLGLLIAAPVLASRPAQAHTAPPNPVFMAPNQYFNRTFANPRFTIETQVNPGSDDSGYINMDIDFTSAPTCPAPTGTYDDRLLREHRILGSDGAVLKDWTHTNSLGRSLLCQTYDGNFPFHWGRDSIGFLPSGYRHFEVRLIGNKTGTLYLIAKDTDIFDPPAAPSDLSEIETLGSMSEIGWTDNSSNETGFEIERSLDASAWDQVGTVATDITSFLDEGLRLRTTYHYRVRAVNAAGVSDWSNVLTISTSGVPDGQLTGVCGRADAIAPCTTGGDPVNTATGAYMTSVTDLALPGIGLPFALTRSYDSGSTVAGDLGARWTRTYAERLEVEGDGDVVLHGPSGQQVFYKKRSDGSFVADAGGLSTLSSVTGGYKLETLDAISRSFDATGALTSISDRNGNTLTLSYSSGLLGQVTDTAGRSIDFTHNGSGLLTGISLPDGRSVSYGYTSGLLTSVTDVRGNSTTYNYDGNQRLDTVVDQNNHTVVDNTYGPDGRVTQQTDARGKLWQFAWNATTETSTVTDPRGKQWVDDYDGNVLVSRTDPLGNETSYSYDSDLNLVGITDARNNSTTMTYDGRGNMLTRASPAPLSYSETWTYNSNNEPLTYQNGRGKIASYAYGTSGNLVSVTQPGNTVTTLTRDATTGLVTEITDPRNKTTTFAYDAAGNLTSVTTPKGKETSYGLDSSGRVTSMVEARGNEMGATPSDYTWTYGYDAANHLTSSTDPLGNAESWAYDPAGNLSSSTDQNSHATSYGYDAANNLTSVTAPDQTATSYAYDDAGNLASRTDANTHSTNYAYDGAGQLASTTSPGGKVSSYSYDPTGNLKTITDAATVVSTFSYDELGRVTSIDYSDSTPDVGFSYDANGNLTGMTDGAGSESRSYDDLDRLTGVTRGTQSFAYAYDAAGNLTSRTYPDSTQTTYAYDDDSQMTGATQGTRTTTYAYDPAGRIKSIALPAGNGHTETRTYDRAGRVTGVRNASATATLSEFTYTLDPAGNPTTVVGPDGTTTFSYDSLDRLKRACYPPLCSGILGTAATVYGYDGVGNRISETTGTATVTYSHDADDRLTARTSASGTTYSHDPNGNMTGAGSKSYAYDAVGRMTSATVGGQTTTYAYDGLGKRQSATKGTDVTSFLWDTNHPLPELAYETDGGGTQLRRYTYGAAGAISMRAGGAEHYLHRDRMGSVTDVTGGSGLPEWSFAYGAFGEERAATKVDPLAPAVPARYTGQYLDDTGLYHLRARQYDAGLGRFSGPEPLPHPPSIPYSSAYGYVRNMPTQYDDPSGLAHPDGPGATLIWCWNPDTLYGGDSNDWPCGDPIEPSLLVKAAHFFTPACGPLTKGGPIIGGAAGSIFGGPLGSAVGFEIGTWVATIGVGACPAIGAIGNAMGEPQTS